MYQRRRYYILLWEKCSAIDRYGKLKKKNFKRPLTVVLNLQKKKDEFYQVSISQLGVHHQLV